MATYDYSVPYATATRLITKYGNTVTIERTGTTTTWVKSFNASEGRYQWTDADDPANIVYEAPDDNVFTYTGVGILTSYETSVIDGTIIQVNDRLLLCQFDEEPQQNDIFTIGSESLQYVTHNTVSPDNVTKLVYKVQVRAS